jgi:hypothetical protein
MMDNSKDCKKMARRIKIKMMVISKDLNQLQKKLKLKKMIEFHSQKS